MTLSLPLRRLLAPLFAIALVALAAIVLTADVALAQVAPDGNASPDTPASAVFTVNNTLVTVLLGMFAPIVTGILLRPTNPAWVKVLAAGAVGTAFTAISQAVQADGTAPLSQEWFLQLALQIATQVGTYYGVWNPLFASRGGLNAAAGPGILPGGTAT